MGVTYLKPEIGCVVDEHYHSADAEVVGEIGERDERNGCDMVDEHNPKILKRKSMLHARKPR